jgi:hypothetical protein
MLIMPLGDFQWVSPTAGVVIALRIKASDDDDRRLQKRSLRQGLLDKNTDILNPCVVGMGTTQNGLQDFFVGRSDNGTQNQFPGFKVGLKITTDPNDITAYNTSVNDMFNNYENFYTGERKVSRDTCEETLKGITLTAASALVINGWWLPQTLDKYEKAN